MAQSNTEFTILSDVTVPSGRIADKGELQHHVMLRDSDGNLYTVLIPDQVYTPELAVTMAAQQQRLKAMERLNRFLRTE